MLSLRIYKLQLFDVLFLIEVFLSLRTIIAIIVEVVASQLLILFFQVLVRLLARV